MGTVDALPVMPERVATEWRDVGVVQGACRLSTWYDVKAGIEGQGITLGPYFGHQVRHDLKHLLFTLSRYKFATKMLQPKSRVLELGCSEGLGCLMMQQAGHTVFGVDSDHEAILMARRTVESATFIEGDFLELGSWDSVDAVVSLDVIEHVDPLEEYAFMRAVVDNLNVTGMAIIGTPNIEANEHASRSSRAAHVNLYSRELLSSTMRQFFKTVLEFSMNDEVVHTGFAPMAHYLFAVGIGVRT
jgi:2-polyprenyl-3-methyl-5-hydroxy-6-metoxy-1,4-benzoquinol methylase